MISDFLGNALVICYFFAAFLLMLYGANCYIMVYLFSRTKTRMAHERKQVLDAFDYEVEKDHLPHVTTQIPLYNEINVAERIIRAACAMVYPDHLHEIQVLDDSTDETCQMVDELVRELNKQGHDIVCIRRHNREGYKAGALAHGMDTAKGAFVAIFDADFVPPADFLTRTIPFFLTQKKLGLVQARWGHLNSDHSLLTRAQSIGIDGHFMVEQAARNGAGLFMNFNGTAGVFRKTAIEGAGGWHWDTLTEDMDLSYRVQFAGWGTVYLPDLVVPAEIPETIRAFKSQQFRWAKGSLETFLKLFPTILKADIPVFKKVEAYFHMTHYLVHPLMLFLSVMALPVMALIEIGPGPYVFASLAVLLLLSVSAPNFLYIVSQRSAYNNWLARIIFLPGLVIVGTGIALSNSRAVFEAFTGKKSPFIRTPKKGDAPKKDYHATLPVSALFELGLGLYCSLSFILYLSHGKYLVGPFLAIYASGFTLTGLLSLRR